MTISTTDYHHFLHIRLKEADQPDQTPLSVSEDCPHLGATWSTVLYSADLGLEQEMRQSPPNKQAQGWEKCALPRGIA